MKNRDRGTARMNGGGTRPGVLVLTSLAALAGICLLAAPVAGLPPGVLLVTGLVFSVWGAFVTGLFLERRRRRQVEVLRQAADLDETLGILNSKACRRQIRRAMRESRRSGDPFAVCLLDVDGLKAINDRFGYGEGDRLLRGIVRCLESRIRPSDQLFRYKFGDEFLVLARQTPAGGAALLAERLRALITQLPAAGDGPQVTGAVTVSAGVAGFDPDRDRDLIPELLFQRAETALRTAKKKKNTVQLFDAAAHIQDSGGE